MVDNMTVNASGSSNAAPAPPVEPAESTQTSSSQQMGIASCSNTGEGIASGTSSTMAGSESVYALMAGAPDSPEAEKSSVMSKVVPTAAKRKPIPEPEPPTEPSVYTLMADASDSSVEEVGNSEQKTDSSEEETKSSEASSD